MVGNIATDFGSKTTADDRTATRVISTTGPHLITASYFNSYT